MAVLIASNLRKEIAGEPLFDGVSFKVERRDRVALAGPNGAGKTTLLRILTRETSLHGGELAFEKGTRVALHDQRPPLSTPAKSGGQTPGHVQGPAFAKGTQVTPDDQQAPSASAATSGGQTPGHVPTLREYVLSGAAELVATEEELRRLERAMAAGAHDPATLAAYARAQARLEHAGGYAWRERASGAVRGLGFADEDLDRGLTTFSGGELTRASLARALAGDPDLLLLDEPTNHLDIASLEWLERELASLDAACIVVAHDRWFLEAVTNATLELEAGRSTFFPGPWHVWRREKAQRALHAQKTADRVSEDIARLERFVERFRYKKTKAKQAQAKLTQISRLERERGRATAEADLLTRGTRRLGFAFAEPKRSGRDVLVIENATVSVPGRELLGGVSLALVRGDHLALVGPNGSGKTTLLEEIVAGRHKLGYGVELAYFSQHEAELDERGSVLDCVQSMTGLTRPRAQALLGRFLFSGWDAHEKAVTALSGGERRRLALAVLVASGANFLVLDEPTNHLDLESREALEAALESFPGTVLLVSHDRALLDAVAHRTAAIEDGALQIYDGGWADLLARRAERESAPEPTPPRPKKEGGRLATPRPERSRLDLIEAEIERKEHAIAQLEERLAEDWADADLVASHRRAREELHALLAEWEALLDRV